MSLPHPQAGPPTAPAPRPVKTPGAGFGITCHRWTPGPGRPLGSPAGGCPDLIQWSGSLADAAPGARPLRILQRYVWREMALNFLGVTLTLAAILFVYQVGTVLARAAELQYPQAVVLGLIGLGAAQTFSTLLPPLGLLLGIVLALGRL